LASDQSWDTCVIGAASSNYLKLYSLTAAGSAGDYDVEWVAERPRAADEPTDSGWNTGTTVADTVQTVRFRLQSYLLSSDYPNVPVRLMDNNGVLVSTATTGSDGSVSFSLYRSRYYTVTFIDEARGVNASWYGYPWDSDNIVWFMPSNWNLFGWIGGLIDNAAGYFGNGTNETTLDVTKGVGSAVNFGELSGGQGFFAGLYSDSSEGTSTTDYTLYKFNKTTLQWDDVDNATESGSSNTHNFTIAGVANNTYRLNMTGHSAVYGTVYSSCTSCSAWRRRGNP
jgi:hypothetical protein